MNIFVSNLGSFAHKGHLQNLFSEFGIVRLAIISKGLLPKGADTSCLVIIDNRDDAVNAIRNLDQTSFMGKIINVRRAIFRI